MCPRPFGGTWLAPAELSRALLGQSRRKSRSVMPDALPIEPTAPDFFDDDGVGAENVPDEPYLGHGSATLLVEGIEAIEAAPGSHRRRAELVERAMAEHELDLDFAEYIYDI